MIIWLWPSFADCYAVFVPCIVLCIADARRVYNSVSSFCIANFNVGKFFVLCAVRQLRQIETGKISRKYFCGSKLICKKLANVCLQIHL